jgi:hypothetical protein
MQFVHAAAVELAVAMMVPVGQRSHSWQTAAPADFMISPLAQVFALHASAVATVSAYLPVSHAVHAVAAAAE